MCTPSPISHARLAAPITLSLALALRIGLIAVALLLAWAQFQTLVHGTIVNGDARAWAQHFNSSSSVAS